MDKRSNSRGNSTRTNTRYQPYKNIVKRTSYTNSQFTIWKQRIDNYVFDKINRHLEDLPDLSYRQWFDEGYLKPSQVAYIVLGEYYQIYNLNQLYFNY
tara:strand:- start:1789 stop:2082 length:294 start_codon:yes stop_codon:yes gene_type:complete